MGMDIYIYLWSGRQEKSIEPCLSVRPSVCPSVRLLTSTIFIRSGSNFGGFILKHVVTFCKKPKCFILLCSSHILLTDGQTDRQTDRQTDGRTDRHGSIDFSCLPDHKYIYIYVNTNISPFDRYTLLYKFVGGNNSVVGTPDFFSQLSDTAKLNYVNLVAHII